MVIEQLMTLSDNINNFIENLKKVDITSSTDNITEEVFFKDTFKLGFDNISECLYHPTALTFLD